jgi:hypothetical protein
LLMDRVHVTHLNCNSAFFHLIASILIVFYLKFFKI